VINKADGSLKKRNARDLGHVNPTYRAVKRKKDDPCGPAQFTGVLPPHWRFLACTTVTLLAAAEQ
jgi:hypothetical protein